VSIESSQAARMASVAVFLVLASSLISAQRKQPGRSGVFQTAADFEEGRLIFESECGSKSHRVDVHDILHKPYIDVTHDFEKHRYQKNDLFGFRACDGRNYRFAGKREYQILEGKDLYIYAHKVWVRAGRSSRRVRIHSFSVGPEGPLLPLTPEDLKRAFPENQRFHASLDRMTGTAGVQEYDERHHMFTVNWLLMASREPER
jgi:hypothetical protein